MTRPVVNFPWPLLRALQVDWDIDWRGSPTSEATSKFRQTVFNEFPQWVGSLELSFPPEFIGHWRALRWAAEGRAGIWRVPMIDFAIFNRGKVYGGVLSEKGIPFATGQRFSSGYGFDISSEAITAAAASAGSTRVDIFLSDLALVPSPGQIISANDWPMGVVSVEDIGAGVHRLGIRMPLREAIASGDRVKLVGEGLFEVLEDMAGRATYGLNMVSTPSISFREVLNR